jgi:hypothetical protein
MLDAATRPRETVVDGRAMGLRLVALGIARPACHCQVADLRGPQAVAIGDQDHGRVATWNGCQLGWTVQDGLCKPYRGY